MAQGEVFSRCPRSLRGQRERRGGQPVLARCPLAVDSWQLIPVRVSGLRVTLEMGLGLELMLWWGSLLLHGVLSVHGIRFWYRCRCRFAVYHVKIKTIVTCFHQTWRFRIDLIPPLYPRFLHGIQHSPTTPTTSVRTVFIAIALDDGSGACHLSGIIDAGGRPSAVSCPPRPAAQQSIVPLEVRIVQQAATPRQVAMMGGAAGTASHRWVLKVALVQHLVAVQIVVHEITITSV